MCQCLLSTKKNKQSWTELFLSTFNLILLTLVSFELKAFVSWPVAVNNEFINWFPFELLVWPDSNIIKCQICHSNLKSNLDLFLSGVIFNILPIYYSGVYQKQSFIYFYNIFNNIICLVSC